MFLNSLAVCYHKCGSKTLIFDGLIVDYAKQRNSIVLIRGLRAVSDFEFEFQIALMNRKIDPDVNTIFMMPHEKYTYLNSSIIRELARLGQDVGDFVSPYTAAKLKEKFHIPEIVE